jgi:hypothetical protein
VLSRAFSCLCSFRLPLTRCPAIWQVSEANSAAEDEGEDEKRKRLAREKQLRELKEQVP